MIVAVPVSAWFAIPTIKHWLAPPSAVNVQLLRIGMTADEVRLAVGEPTARGFGTWKFGKPGELADTGVGVYFDADGTVCGWTDLATGATAGRLPSGPPPDVRGPWP